MPRIGLAAWGGSEWRAWVVVLCPFRSAGKAVKTGHSCAAVTHHRPASRIRGSKASRATGEGAGEEARHGSREICGVRTSAPGCSRVRFVCAKRSRKLHRKNEAWEWSSVLAGRAEVRAT